MFHTLRAQMVRRPWIRRQLCRGENRWDGGSSSHQHSGVVSSQYCPRLICLLPSSWGPCWQTPAHPRPCQSSLSRTGVASNKGRCPKPYYNAQDAHLLSSFCGGGGDYCPGSFSLLGIHFSFCLVIVTRKRTVNEKAVCSM